VSQHAIAAGGLVSQRSREALVYVADWGTNALPEGTTLVDAGTFRISPDDGLVTIDAAELLAGGREVRFRVGGGRHGRRYRIWHRVVTTGPTAQAKEQGFRLLVRD
jgi:hypothetical protein